MQQDGGDVSHELRVLSRVLRAAVEVLEAELVEGDAPDSDPTGEGEAANDPPRAAARAKRRKGVRPAYRPQGPVDEVSARRADEALKRAGLVPASPRRK
jgi:hypothetical protein